MLVNAARIDRDGAAALRCPSPNASSSVRKSE
jgi:hypothetical protein